METELYLLPSDCLIIGRAGVLDRQSAFWTFRYVENLANLRYSAMIKDIKLRQAKWEDRGIELRQQVIDAYQTDHNATQLTATLVHHAEDVLADWWQLADALMLKYADGFITTNMGPVDAAVAPGYPAWWLKQVGYQSGPPPVHH